MTGIHFSLPNLGAYVRAAAIARFFHKKSTKIISQPCLSANVIKYALKR